MKRAELFAELEKIKDPARDFPKLLSNLHYTHFFMMDQYKKILSVYGLTSPQSNVLGIIGHFHPTGVSLEEVKSMILEPNSDVSRIVSRLVEKRYVKKLVNKDNRRKITIGLTKSGLRIHHRMITDKHFAKFTSELTLQEAKSFSKILAKLRGAQ